MTAATTAPKQAKRTGGDSVKRQITGPVPIAPAPGGSMHDTGMDSKIIKTATRSKSGCMTCRIRRKKCDLERTGDSCKTCIRLRIECLGWGAKRPEALRDSSVVKECQNQIKIFLASNNMIKGSARASAVALLNAQPSVSQQTSSPLLTTTYDGTAKGTVNGAQPGAQANCYQSVFPVAYSNPSLSSSSSLISIVMSPSDARGSSSSSSALTGAGGGAGEESSSMGQPFLRFDFLRRLDESAAGQQSASPDKHLPRLLPAHSNPNPNGGIRNRHRVAGPSNIRRGSDQDLYPESEEGREEGDDLEMEDEPSSFPRRPSNYVGPIQPHLQHQQLPPHYPQSQPEADWQYGATARPKGLPFQLGPHSPNGHYPLQHPPHPYAQSHLRSSQSLERDSYVRKQDPNVAEKLAELEREREREKEELNRRNQMGAPNLGPGFPSSSHTFIYAPGVGVAAPGRISTGYGPAAYLSPTSDAPPSFQGRGLDPYGGPPRLGGANTDRQLLGPSLSIPRNSNGQSSAFIVDVSSPTPTMNGGSGMPSPDPRFSIGGYTDSSNTASTAVEMETEVDLDGEPMTQTQLSQYTPEPIDPLPKAEPID